MSTPDPATPEDTEATVYAFAEDLAPGRRHSTLARGIVWADILADIAADEASRPMRDAA